MAYLCQAIYFRVNEFPSMHACYSAKAAER
jgi:hypothetical protein